MATDPDLAEVLRMRKHHIEIPEGVDVPMCFCGDPCKLMCSECKGDFYGMRFFMCANYAYDPPKPFGNVIPKVLRVSSLIFLYSFKRTH
jgi:hypothetical protein